MATKCSIKFIVLMVLNHPNVVRSQYTYASLQSQQAHQCWEYIRDTPHPNNSPSIQAKITKIPRTASPRDSNQECGVLFVYSQHCHSKWRLQREIAESYIECSEPENQHRCVPYKRHLHRTHRFFAEETIRLWNGTKLNISDPHEFQTRKSLCCCSGSRCNAPDPRAFAGMFAVHAIDKSWINVNEPIVPITCPEPTTTTSTTSTTTTASITTTSTTTASTKLIAKEAKLKLIAKDGGERRHLDNEPSINPSYEGSPDESANRMGSYGVGPSMGAVEDSFFPWCTLLYIVAILLIITFCVFYSVLIWILCPNCLGSDKRSAVTIKKSRDGHPLLPKHSNAILTHTEHDQTGLPTPLTRSQGQQHTNIDAAKRSKIQLDNGEYKAIYQSPDETNSDFERRMRERKNQNLQQDAKVHGQFNMKTDKTRNQWKMIEENEVGQSEQDSQTQFQPKVWILDKSIDYGSDDRKHTNTRQEEKIHHRGDASRVAPQVHVAQSSIEQDERRRQRPVSPSPPYELRRTWEQERDNGFSQGCEDDRQTLIESRLPPLKDSSKKAVVITAPAPSSPTTGRERQQKSSYGYVPFFGGKSGSKQSGMEQKGDGGSQSKWKPLQGQDQVQSQTIIRKCSEPAKHRQEQQYTDIKRKTSSPPKTRKSPSPEPSIDSYQEAQIVNPEQGATKSATASKSQSNVHSQGSLSFSEDFGLTKYSEEPHIRVPNPQSQFLYQIDTKKGEPFKLIPQQKSMDRPDTIPFDPVASSQERSKHAQVLSQKEHEINIESANTKLTTVHDHPPELPPPIDSSGSPSPERISEAYYEYADPNQQRLSLVKMAKIQEQMTLEQIEKELKKHQSRQQSRGTSAGASAGASAIRRSRTSSTDSEDTVLICSSGMGTPTLPNQERSRPPSLATMQQGDPRQSSFELSAASKKPPKTQMLQTGKSQIQSTSAQHTKSVSVKQTASVQFNLDSSKKVNFSSF